MKTLYITDLDGTLLTPDEKITAHTAATINALVDVGMLFSYATARPWATAGRLTAPLSARFPVILYNGAFILDNVTGQPIKTNFLPDAESHRILNFLMENQIYPLVYHYESGRETVSWHKEKANEEMNAFLEKYQGEIHRQPSDSEEDLYHSPVYYITCIDSREKLAPLYRALKENPHINVISQQDIYSGRQWLEIMPRAASKASAALQLKQWLSCDRLVCFGDGKNDLSMFSVADECYAVENAVPELKAVATGIIPANTADGVAQWLAENARY